MPVYEYLCEANGRTIQVEHGIGQRLQTWAELCAAAGIEGDDERRTAADDAPLKRLIFAPGISAPMGDTVLREKGFTKLVRRDSGVYENVTASGEEKRYMNAGDASTMPHFHKKISD